MKKLVLLLLFFPLIASAQFTLKDLVKRDDQIEISVLDRDFKEGEKEILIKQAYLFASFVRKAVEHFEIEDDIDVIVRREDEKFPAVILHLPSFDPKKKHYGIYVNPSTLLNISDSIEHIAYHEVCHIVVERRFDGILSGSHELVDDVEFRVERQVYFFVGRKRYMDFLKVNSNLPDVDDEKSRENYQKRLVEIFEAPPLR